MRRVGAGINRIEGPLKVTGQAIYTADVPAERMAYGVLVGSTVARGRIRRIDTRAAERLPGVVQVYTHLNTPRYPGEVSQPPMNESRMALSDDRVHYVGQFVALVLAETLEQAEYGASLVDTAYDVERPVTTFANGRGDAFVPPVGEGMVSQENSSSRGDFARAFATAPVQFEADYGTSKWLQTPMETYATTAVWNGERLTLFDSTQWIMGAQTALASILNLPPDNVRVVSNFVGGGFGAKSWVWPHSLLVAVAARELGRPVKVQFTRTQMQTCTGYQPLTRQTVRLGADQTGRINAAQHTNVCQSGLDNFMEQAVAATRVLYDFPNLETSAQIVKTNHITGGFMRPPGEGTGLFALESAIDELAFNLGMDPLDVRRINHAERDLEVDKPFSAKGLLECYAQGAERFGWRERIPEPRSMHEGRELIGYGVASATRMQFQVNCQAGVTLRADGSAVARTSVAEIGCGAYTTLAQIAAEDLALPYERVSIEGGDSTLPGAAPSFGSMTSAATANAVKLAAMDARRQAAEHAVADEASPLFGANVDDLVAQDGRLVLSSEPFRSERYQEILERAGVEEVEGVGQFRYNAEESPFSSYTFGAQFAEVRVDEALGRVRVSRFLGAYSAGRILNEKTATSQAKGGIIFGIGTALTEGVHHDYTSGRLLNANLFDYQVPVNADIPSSDIDVMFIDDGDTQVNGLGSKGIGELVTIGVNAAVANAVYHATGKRIRTLPITLDKLL